MTPRPLYWTCLVVAAGSLACATALPPPEPLPAVSPRVQTPPALPESQLTLPLAVPLQMLREMAAQAVELPSRKRFERVSAPGDNPEVEVRYQSRLGDVQLQSQGRVLRSTIEVLYHGELRARAKTPFGNMWLTRGSAWGSAKDPGRIQIEIHTRLSVRPDWTLKASSTLKDVRFESPATAKLCTRGPIKLCLSRGRAARLVHAELDTLVRREVTSALHHADRRLSERAPLRDVARALWQRLQSTEAGVQLMPRALVVASPEVRDEQLVVDVRVRAQPRFHDLDKRPSSPLPSPSRPRTKQDVLHLGWPLSWQAWGDALSRRARRLPQGQGELHVDRVAVQGAAEEPGHYWWTITLTDGAQFHAVHLEAQLATAGGQLAAQALTWTPASRARLTALGLSPDGFLQSLREATPLDLRELLSEPLQRVRRTLTRSVQPLPVSALRDVRLTLEGVYAQPHGLWLQARGG